MIVNGTLIGDCPTKKQNDKEYILYKERWYRLYKKPYGKEFCYNGTYIVTEWNNMQ